MYATILPVAKANAGHFRFASCLCITIQLRTTMNNRLFRTFEMTSLCKKVESLSTFIHERFFFYKINHATYFCRL